MNHSVYNILKKDCVKCGMCFTVCPVQAISMHANHKTGFYDFSVNEEKCVNCGKCKASCPANGKINTADSAVGSYSDIYLVHSTNQEVRTNSTSGGAVNSFLRYLIDNRIIDSAYVLRENNKNIFECEVIEINPGNSEELLLEPRRFASRYVSYPVLAALKNKNKKRIAIVGTPCQIKAVSKSDFSSDVIKIGIACSGAMSYNASKILKEQLASDDYHLFYRGNGWPGKNSLIKNNSAVIEQTHQKSCFEKMFSSWIFKNKACLNCNDQFASAADISFFDFWNKDEMKNEHIGNSAVIIRTDLAERHFLNCAKENYIEIQKKISEKDAVKTQSGPLLLKQYRLHRKFPLNLYFSAVKLTEKSHLYKFIPLKKYKKIIKIYNRLINITKRIHKA